MFWGKQIKIYERLKKLMGPGVGGMNGSGPSIIGVVGIYPSATKVVPYKRFKRVAFLCICSHRLV